MGIAELEEYFGNNEKSYDSTYLIKVLEGILGKPFNEIREDLVIYTNGGLLPIIEIDKNLVTIVKDENEDDTSIILLK